MADDALELVGDRVARVMAGLAQAGVLGGQRGPVDDAVDLVVEPWAILDEALKGRLQLVLLRDLKALDAEADRLEEVELGPLVWQVGADHVVGEEREVGRAALARILLLDGAGGEVARVGVLFFVELEVAERHVELAADLDLDPLGVLRLDRRRHVGHSHDVDGDVLALGARAAGRREDERALLVVAQRAGDPVHLRHDDEVAGDLVGPGEEIGLVVALAQREHRPLVDDGRPQALARGEADRLVGVELGSA